MAELKTRKNNASATAFLVDESVLRKLIAGSVKHMRTKYEST